jgi:hypothetical protein
MPAWFLVLLLIVVAVAVILAIAMAYSRRSAASGQNTTIIEDRSPTSDQNSDQRTTVVERD